MFVKSPIILKKLFPDLIWEIDTNKKEIFLTFDDGPHSDITLWVLDELDKYNADATFFCVGENVCKNPDTFLKLSESRHSVGNHTYNHLNGWKSSNTEYFDNIKKAAKQINSGLFRPPYGRISPSQISNLKNSYSIIMWSILSYDFSDRISKERCLNNSIGSTKAGSIVVFHDSIKSAKNLKYALPLFLKHFTEQGFTFNKL